MGITTVPMDDCVEGHTPSARAPAQTAAEHLVETSLMPSAMGLHILTSEMNLHSSICHRDVLYHWLNPGDPVDVGSDDRHWNYSKKLMGGSVYERKSTVNKNRRFEYFDSHNR